MPLTFTGVGLAGRRAGSDGIGCVGRVTVLLDTPTLNHVRILFWLGFSDWCIVWLCLVAKKVQKYTQKLKKLRIKKKKKVFLIFFKFIFPD